MSVTKIISAATEVFKQKFAEMCQKQQEVLDKVDNETFARMTAILMDAARAAGVAGLEQFLRENDTVAATITKKDTVYRYKGSSSKELLTLFGPVTVDRAMYYDENNGGEYFFPLDNALGLEKDDYATLDTREMILFAAAACVPRELAALFGKCSLCRPSRTAIQNIIKRDGQTMEAVRGQLAHKVFNESFSPPEETAAFVASLDGVNVLLREEGKKKGRKNKRPGGNFSSDQQTTSYHNAMVGAVSFYGGVDDENRPKRLCSIYNARMPQEKSIDFKSDFERMVTIAEKKVTATAKTDIPRILLTDGHLMIKGFAKESYVLRPYEKLLDFYHATEHLSRAAEAIYGEQTDISRAYYHKWRANLKTDPGAPAAILRSLKSFWKRNKLPAKRMADLKTEITFFRKNRTLMKYFDFLKRGLPIGSGPIEAAAKTIVRQRMCRSGMSWSREKGQHILTIRAYVQSGLWEDAWRQFIKIKKTA